VYRVGADETVQRADVGIGGRREGMAEITSGLEVGERIVVDGTGKLRPGQKIEATPVAGIAAADPPAGKQAGE
jgi:membrane fusion protein, multidrug efflux system